MTVEAAFFTPRKGAKYHRVTTHEGGTVATKCGLMRCPDWPPYYPPWPRRLDVMPLSDAQSEGEPCRSCFPVDA